MNLLYNTTRFFYILFLLFGFAFAQAQAQDLVVTPTAAVTDVQDGFTALNGAWNITTVVIGEKTYALVAGFDDDGVQVMDITDPASPTATAAVTDVQDGFALDGANGITTAVIGEKTYALVASFNDDSVQVMDITNPASPTPTAAVTDGEGGFTELDGAWDITTVVIGEKTYALVASSSDDGVQVMDITNPASPTATAAVTDGQDEDGFTALNGARSVTTVVIGDKTYALVASFNDDGVQIMEISTSSTLSTGELFFKSLVLYPNPVRNRLHIESPLAEAMSYKVYDLTGKALSTHHKTGQSHSIDVSGLAKGVYLLEATHNNNTTAMQFVKE